MNKAFRLYVIELARERADLFRQEFASLHQVTVSSTYAAALETSGGIDALVVSLMSATEWGAVPIPAPLYKTSVIRMPKHEVSLGRPLYAIPGVAIAPGEVLTPSEVTRLVLRETFCAIESFNISHNLAIGRVAAVSSSLGLNRLESGEARELLSEALSAFTSSR